MDWNLVLIALGPVLASSAWLAWSGRWRSWVDDPIFGWSPGPLALFPGLALMLPAFALVNLGVLPSDSPIAVFGFLLSLAGMAITLWAPRWFGPRWYRERNAPGARRARARHDPMAALMEIDSRARPTGSESPFAGAPLARWSGTWVYGDETAPRQQPLLRPGAVYGHLSLYRDGLHFRANGMEERAREEAVSVTVPAARLRDVRVVPSGAGTDGQPTPGPRLRVAFTRLVVDTDDGPYLFEVHGAKDKARTIRERIGARHA
jgi:hypothetical protein